MIHDLNSRPHNLIMRALHLKVIASMLSGILPNCQLLNGSTRFTEIDTKPIILAEVRTPVGAPNSIIEIEVLSHDISGAVRHSAGRGFHHLARQFLTDLVVHRRFHYHPTVVLERRVYRVQTAVAKEIRVSEQSSGSLCRKRRKGGHWERGSCVLDRS